MTLIFKTDYAQSAAPWGVPYQCPPGKITRGKEQDGRAYQRHECDPGVNWNGMQRADAMDTGKLTPYVKEGQEIALAWAELLEPGFFAPNPGWCVVGAEIHDSSGNTQSPLELLTSQNGIQVRCFGGVIGSIPPGVPVNTSDKFCSQTFPVSIGAYHDLVLGLVLSGDRTKGRVRFAIDGRIVLDKFCATLYSGRTGYLKLAFYRDQSQSRNKVAAVRFGNMSAYAGQGAWDEAFGTAPPPPPPPVSRPIHDAVAKVDATANPNIRHALDLIADKIEP